MSSRERAKFVSRRVGLHLRHPKIGPLGFLLGLGNAMNSSTDTGPQSIDQKGTGRLTGNGLLGSVTNKFIPERDDASTFCKTDTQRSPTSLPLEAGVFQQLLLSFLAA